MKKKWISFTAMIILTLMYPMAAFAEDNPFTKLKDKMKFNWKTIDGLEWLFYIIMIPISLALICLLLYTIWGVIAHMWNIRKGRANLKDKSFWIEVGFIFLMLFMFFSGAFFSILEQMYDWTNKQDIGKNPPAAGQAYHYEKTPLDQATIRARMIDHASQA